MPNYCDYTMKIIGTKAHCDEFIKRMTDYEAPNHLWRIFEANIDDTEVIGDLEAVYLSGYCAWSLETCCRASGYSGGKDLFAINTKELSLAIEAYSREPGCAFEEHYIYKYGECIVDDVCDIDVFWWDEAEYPTYAEFKRDHPDAPPEDCFDEHEVISGGFGKEFGQWNIF